MLFFQALVRAVAIELVGILGIFFALGFILSKLESYTHAHYRRTVGWYGILFTAWFGTPIHELSHFLLAKLFHHKINAVSFFRPNKQTGGLGHVDHSYKKTSIYQSVGNFFIGGAPLLIGPIILILLLVFLVPNGRTILNSMQSLEPNITLATSLMSLLRDLAAPANIHRFSFWIFLYLSFCVVSHMAPSKQDRGGMWAGLAWLTILLLIANVIPLLLGFHPELYVGRVRESLSLAISVLLFSLLLSFVHFLVSFVLFVIPRRH